MQPVVQEVDHVLEGRAVVFGTPPPDGRDLDVLCLPDDAQRLRAHLAAQGWLRRDRCFVRFDRYSVTVVDVADISTWRVPPDAAEALFAESGLLPGCRHLAVPSPHHDLVLVARRVARDGGRLDPKRRARVSRALERDPRAFESAESVAEAWGALGAIGGLQLAYLQGVSPSVVDRVRSVREELSPQSTPYATFHAARVLARRKRRGAVISLSGLDGSGKTTQADALVAALHSLGYESVTVWTKIARSGVLSALASAAGRVMRALRHTTDSDRDGGPVAVREQREASRTLRQRSAWITHGWAAVVAIANAFDHRRATLRHVRQGRIVVCDRYVLDTAAHLRYRYGVERRFRLQASVNRFITPKALRSYFLAVDPEEALRRKAEQYDLAQLVLLARLYQEEAGWLGVRVLDGEQDAGALCEKIATDVFDALR